MVAVMATVAKGYDLDYAWRAVAHHQPDIESTFATVRHRTKITKGPGSRAAPRRSSVTDRLPRLLKDLDPQVLTITRTDEPSRAVG